MKRFKMIKIPLLALLFLAVGQGAAFATNYEYWDYTSTGSHTGNNGVSTSCTLEWTQTVERHVIPPFGGLGSTHTHAPNHTETFVCTVTVNGTAYVFSDANPPPNVDAALTFLGYPTGLSSQVQNAVEMFVFAKSSPTGIDLYTPRVEFFNTTIPTFDAYRSTATGSWQVCFYRTTGSALFPGGLVPEHLQTCDPVTGDPVYKNFNEQMSDNIQHVLQYRQNQSGGAELSGGQVSETLTWMEDDTVDFMNAASKYMVRLFEEETNFMVAQINQTSLTPLF